MIDYDSRRRAWSKRTELDSGASATVELVVVNNPDNQGHPVIEYADLDPGTADQVELGFRDLSGNFHSAFFETSRYQHRGCRIVGPIGANVVARALDATAAFAATVIANGTILRSS